jgi:hypothetical protein
METNGEIPPLSNLPAPTADELAADSPAAFEQTALALGVDLEHQRAKNDLNKLLREDNLEVHVHRIMKVFLWVAFLLSLSGIVIFAYHEMTPKWLHFLEPDQVDDIKSILFSGGMGAAISFVAQRLTKKS